MFSSVADPDPNPDPLVRGTDPRIRIQVHTKMSWIRNTDVHYLSYLQLYIGVHFRQLI
jgi:hypothetical protein